jgi:hypothetical protein
MNVMQEWTHDISMMQQSVLIAAVRGPDGVTKYHPSKYLLRWYRRCVMLSAMDGTVLTDPISENGGSFTGPSVTQTFVLGADRPRFIANGIPNAKLRETVWDALDDSAGEYLKHLDEVPHHYQLHFMHAVEIVGYKHPDRDIASWFYNLYVRIVADMHLQPETEEQLDFRLGDSREQWLSVADPATRT